MLKKKYFEKFYLLRLSHVSFEDARYCVVSCITISPNHVLRSIIICIIIIIIIRIEINHLVFDSVECQLKASFTRVGEVLVA